MKSLQIAPAPLSPAPINPLTIPTVVAKNNVGELVSSACRESGNKASVELTTARVMSHHRLAQKEKTKKRVRERGLAELWRRPFNYAWRTGWAADTFTWDTHTHTRLRLPGRRRSEPLVPPRPPPRLHGPTAHLITHVLRWHGKSVHCLVSKQKTDLPLLYLGSCRTCCASVLLWFFWCLIASPLASKRWQVKKKKKKKESLVCSDIKTRGDEVPDDDKGKKKKKKKYISHHVSCEWS